MNLSISSGVTHDPNTKSVSSLSQFRQRFHFTPVASPANLQYQGLYNDYTNHFIHNRCEKPTAFIRNVDSPLIGYPKLKKLVDLKAKKVSQFRSKPFGLRLDFYNMIPYLNKMIAAQMKFDVIIIGSLTENQFVLPFLVNLPLSKLCAKPGFLFVWASSSQINELSNILNNQKFTNWNNFRKSEELIFIPVDNTLGESSNESLFESNQWHCWMCITGTVRRSIDNHLIHCNIDTDLKIESSTESSEPKTSTPEFIYRIAENFSSGNRRLHIIPSRSGFKNYVKPRPGWCIVSPDIMLNNFNMKDYQSEINKFGVNVKYDEEIEKMRPKSPRRFNSNNSNNHHH